MLPVAFASPTHTHRMGQKARSNVELPSPFATNSSQSRQTVARKTHIASIVPLPAFSRQVAKSSWSLSSMPHPSKSLITWKRGEDYQVPPIKMRGRGTSKHSRWSEDVCVGDATLFPSLLLIKTAKIRTNRWMHLGFVFSSVVSTIPYVTILKYFCTNATNMSSRTVVVHLWRYVCQ